MARLIASNVKLLFSQSQGKRWRATDVAGLASFVLLL